MTDEFPNNSHNPPRPPAARQRQTPVITNVGVRKRSIGSRASDRATTVLSDVFHEVVKPLMLDTLAEALHAATDFSVFRTDRPGGRRPAGSGYRARSGRPNQQQVSNAGYVVTDYSAPYQGGSAPASTQYDPYHKPFDFSIYTFPDYASGRELIDRLRHLVYAYHRASANDLLDLMNKPSTIDSTGENYGWDTLAEIDAADVKRVRGSGGLYYLDIPDAHPIK